MSKRGILRDLGLIALCILIWVGGSYLIDIIIPPVPGDFYL